jgi:N-acyl homoserine lactone hydrolase
MRLYVLDFGLFQVHENGRIIGIPGFLIEAKGATILVDTGLPAPYLEDPDGAARADTLDCYGRVVELTAEHMPAAQLARAGRTPADITHLVLTHSHVDHIGGLASFPQATIVVGKAERELPAPLYWGATRRVAWPNQRYQLIDSDTDLVPGVKLLYTPGHSPGHLSILIRLPKTGPLLLTADAISRPDELADNRFKDAWNPTEARRSAHRLMALASKRDALVIFGHDPKQWTRIRKAPEYFA